MPSATAREFQRVASQLGFARRRQTGSHERPSILLTAPLSTLYSGEGRVDSHPWPRPENAVTSEKGPYGVHAHCRRGSARCGRSRALRTASSAGGRPWRRGRSGSRRSRGRAQVELAVQMGCFCSRRPPGECARSGRRRIDRGAPGTCVRRPVRFLRLFCQAPSMRSGRLTAVFRGGRIGGESLENDS